MQVNNNNYHDNDNNNHNIDTNYNTMQYPEVQIRPEPPNSIRFLNLTLEEVEGATEQTDKHYTAEEWYSYQYYYYYDFYYYYYYYYYEYC